MKNKILISIIIVCILYGVILYIFSIDIWDSLLFGILSLFVAIGVPFIIMCWQAYKHLENEPKTALKWSGGALGYFFLIGMFIYLLPNNDDNNNSTSRRATVYTCIDPYTDKLLTIELFPDETGTIFDDVHHKKISWDKINIGYSVIRLESGDIGYIRDGHLYEDYADMKAKRDGIKLRKK